LIVSAIVCFHGCGKFGRFDRPRPDSLAGSTELYSFSDWLPQAWVVHESSFIDFGESDSARLVDAGWGSPEIEEETGASFSWAVGRESRVTVELASVGTANIEFRCWPYQFDGAPQQAVDVAVNGKLIGNVVLGPEADVYVLGVPDGVLIPGTNEILLRFAYAESPRGHGFSDPRNLAAAFDYLKVGAGHASVETKDTPRRPRAVRKDLVVPAGTAAVFTLRAPVDAVLDLGRVDLKARGGGRVRAEVWMRAGVSPSRELLRVSDPPGRDRTWQLPLDVAAGTPIQVGFTAVGPEPRRGRTSEVVWRSPRLYGRQGVLEGLTDVVLIVVDTLRADHVGAYGGDVKTPNIDALAARGVMFRNAYSHIPITGPSHASLFTSMLPSQHGVHNNGQILPPRLNTLAGELGYWGRSSAAFVSLGVLNSTFGFANDFDEYHDRFGLDWMKDAEQVNGEVMEWFDDAPQGSRFLFVHYSDPHEPYAPPGLSYPEIKMTLRGREIAIVPANGRGTAVPVEVAPGSHLVQFEPPDPDRKYPIRFPHIEMSDDELEIRLRSGWRERTKRFGSPAYDTDLPATVEIVNPTRSTITANLEMTCRERLKLPEIRALYAKEVEFVDRQIGVLLRELDRRNRLDRSLVIFTSDHGEGLGDHRHVGHISQLYDTLIRVPLLFVFPGRLPEGVVVDDRVSLIDVAPTIADLLGIPAIPGGRGSSLTTLMTGESMPARPVIAETFRPESYSDKRAIISDGYKYIHSRRDHEWEELYDIVNDPEELTDLSKRLPERMAELREQLDRELETGASSQAAQAELSDDDRARLRALGYVH
jgi:arylsulfatase A-like enzyme